MPYENMSGSITRPAALHCHALLFAGIINVSRYPLSLVRWTNLLHEMYGYPLENIRILIGPYTISPPDWPAMVAGTDTTYDATMTDLDNALAAYGVGGSHALGADDTLFIFTFDHGGNDFDGLGSYICCDPPPGSQSYMDKYYASNFASRIANIHCKQIVYLAAQCYSGGFVDPFMGALAAGVNGAIMAGCRSDQVTWEAVCDKLFASAFNGRMVQDPLDDNIDLGITGDGVDVYLVPGYQTGRIDWGPTGCLSTREAFNWVYSHYVDHIYSNPSYSWVDEVPLYRQTPWTDANGHPFHIRLGEPELAMQDCAADTGLEPSTGTCASPWHSPDVYPDNTDQFPGTTTDVYVPAHHNRFFVRTANRGTAPTDFVWRNIEVRGLGFTGGPVGPPRVDLATETSGNTTVSARIRPLRAHTQYTRILIGADYGHGCVSAASFTGCDPWSHNQWLIVDDNDQVQHNIEAAAVSGSVPVPATATNSNAGKLMLSLPLEAAADAAFEFKPILGKADIPATLKFDTPAVKLSRGARAVVNLEMALKKGTRTGTKFQVSYAITRDGKPYSGVTFNITVADATLLVGVYDQKGLPVPRAKVLLTAPGDPRKLYATTDAKGLAKFAPINPGFYFAYVAGAKTEPVRVWAAPNRETQLKLKVDKSGRAILRPIDPVRVKELEEFANKVPG